MTKLQISPIPARLARALRGGLALLMAIAGGSALEMVTARDAQARLGRPATPNSVAGVARRSTRRTVHRHTAIALGTHVTVLPASCAAVVHEDVTYHVCDGVYYRRYYEGSQVVYVVVEAP
jgi:hypothetical protein